MKKIQPLVLSDDILGEIVAGVTLQNPVFIDEGASDPRIDNQDPGAGAGIASIVTGDEYLDFGDTLVTGPQALTTGIDLLKTYYDAGAIGDFTSVEQTDEAPGQVDERPSVLDGSAPSTPGAIA